MRRAAVEPAAAATNSSETHDPHAVARLIFESDPVFNTLTYGKDPVTVIKAMLRLGESYFDPSYTRCAIHEGCIVGVIVGFPVSEKAHIDQKSGKDFARAMGFFRFVSRMPLFIRMDRMMPTVDDQDGYYVHTITVDAEYRGRGIGSEMIERVAEGSMVHKGHELSHVLMRRG